MKFIPIWHATYKDDIASSTIKSLFPLILKFNSIMCLAMMFYFSISFEHELDDPEFKLYFSNDQIKKKKHSV